MLTVYCDIGKSSFLRATAGLWTNGFGSISWNHAPFLQGHSDLTQTHASADAIKLHGNGSITSLVNAFFLPQKPYNILGDLREQIRYPSQLTNRTADSTYGHAIDSSISHTTQPKETDEYFLSLLKRVKLDNLAYRLGNGNETAGLSLVRDWGKVLSLGEQQRLAFARVVYNEPSVCFLDGSYVSILTLIYIHLSYACVHYTCLCRGDERSRLRIRGGHVPATK